MSILSAIHLSKSYDGKLVLDDINLELEQGEILAIIGRSGSGKSTLIRCLAGLLDVASGEVRLHGEIIEGPKKRLVPGYEEIRLVHQDFQLKHKMSVRENIRYELLAYMDDYQEERINTLLELCRITHLQHKDIAQVSGGEKQRVAIARALATEPDVILMDEPFSNLDINTKYRLLEELKVIASSTETAIILITHDARDAMEIADRAFVLKNGKIIRGGLPEELYHDPQLPGVAELIGFYNEFTPQELNLLVPDLEANGNKFGIWAEDILIGSGTNKASVVNVIFGGPYQKVHLNYQGLNIWTFDFSKKIRIGDQITFSIRQERIFKLSNF